MIECLFTNFKKGSISAINAKQQNSHWVAVHWSSADYLPNNDAASSSEAGSGTPAAPPKPAPDCPPFLSPPFLSPSLSIFPILTPVCVRADDDTDADDDEHDNKNCDYNNTLSKRPDLPPLQRTENRESAQPDFARFFPLDWTTAVALLVFCDYTWFLLLLLLPSPYITFLDTFLGLFFLLIFAAPGATSQSSYTSAQLGSASHTQTYNQRTDTGWSAEPRSETRSTRFYLQHHFHSLRCWTRIALLRTTPSNDIDYLNYSLALCTGIEGDNGLIWYISSLPSSSSYIYRNVERRCSLVPALIFNNSSCRSLLCSSLYDCSFFFLFHELLLTEINVNQKYTSWAER